MDDYNDKEGNPRNSVCVMADEISLGPNNEKTTAKTEETVETVEA